MGLKPDCKENSLQDEGNLPSKSEEQIICLFLRDRFNIKINVRDIPTYINFNNIVKNDLMDVIYNYFFLFQKKVAREEAKFVFKANEVKNFFSFGKMSKLDLYDFIMSVYDLPYDDVSSKGENKINKSYPEITKPSTSRNIKVSSLTKNMSKLKQPKVNNLNKFSKEFRDKTKNNKLCIPKTDLGDECTEYINNLENKDTLNKDIIIINDYNNNATNRTNILKIIVWILTM